MFAAAMAGWSGIEWGLRLGVVVGLGCEGGGEGVVVVVAVWES